LCRSRSESATLRSATTPNRVAGFFCARRKAANGMRQVSQIRVKTCHSSGSPECATGVRFRPPKVAQCGNGGPELTDIRPARFDDSSLSTDDEGGGGPTTSERRRWTIKSTVYAKDASAVIGKTQDKTPTNRPIIMTIITPPLKSGTLYRNTWYQPLYVAVL